MRTQLSRKTSGLGRLFSKMRKRNNSIQQRINEARSHRGDEQRAQQVGPSVDGSDNYSTHFSYRRDEIHPAESDDTVQVSRGRHSDVHEFSEGLLDNDTIELNTTNPHLIARLEEESGLRIGDGRIGDKNITTEPTSSTYDSTAEFTATTLPYQVSNSPIPIGRPTKYYLQALDAHNSDPVPYSQISPQAVKLATQQLGNFRVTGLNRQRCLQQHFRGLQTRRYDMGVSSDKFACEGCSMSPGRVCMRWLRANSFVILPLAPKFRDSLLGSRDLGYWVWEGES